MKICSKCESSKEVEPEKGSNEASDVEFGKRRTDANARWNGGPDVMCMCVCVYVLVFVQPLSCTLTLPPLVKASCGRRGEVKEHR